MALEQQRPTLSDLPNEILLQILLPIRTLALLPLTTVSHRFASLILRILQQRLALSIQLAHNSLIFECYAPSRKRFEPHMLAAHNGSPGLDELLVDSEGNAKHSPVEQFQQLNTLYSCFTPYRPQREKKFQWKHPAGDVPGSRTWRSANGPSDSIMGTLPSAVEAETTPSLQSNIVAQSPPSSHDPGEEVSDHPSSPGESTPPIPVHEPVTTTIHLDAGDLFGQLCAEVNISILGPKAGLFMGMAEVNPNGILRIWRDWLAKRAAVDVDTSSLAQNSEGGGGSGNSEHGVDYTGAASKRASSKDADILWVNHRPTAGIRFRVKEKRWSTQGAAAVGPVLLHRDEEAPVSYELEYREILVRSRDLLLASEELDEQRFNESGKAIVIGRWA